ncbi:MAG TPA: TonB-dependent receptor, partial [Edaphobacter sp.]|nr:TonB-dependent receptor [Edaphobacter sp.]
HSFKGGVNFYHTFLSEEFATGLTDAGYNSPCVDANGVPVSDPSLRNTAQCAPAGYQVNDGYLPGLAKYDLTRGGTLFNFRGRTDIKQEAVYLEDNIAWRSWNFLIGGRADNYNGLSSRSMLQPRLGVTYTFRPTSTVLKFGYSKLFPTPYNENLILSSSTGSGGLASNSGAYGDTALKPGKRNQFNAGIEQALGRYAVLSADYFWKYTDRDFDFDVLFNTPLTFPIQWRKSKIDGFDARVTFPHQHGFDGYVALGHTRARFFGPETGGIIFNSPLETGAFRIDHDQAFEQTTHIQYQPKKTLPWAALTWRFDSGAVAGAVPDYQTALSFTPDQQAQIQLYCGTQVATLSNPIRSCDNPQHGAKMLSIPAPGTYDPDKNPPRIAGRNLLDASLGWDNVLRKLAPNDHVKTDLSITATNLTNKVALYNFLSTFSGTHFVSPRAVSAQVTLNF